MFVTDVIDRPEIVWSKVDWYLNYTGVAGELSKAGFPGMSIVGDDVYPITIVIKTAEERHALDPSNDLAFYEQELLEDRAWMIRAEGELQEAAAHATRLALNVDRLECKVAFFANRNFSGMSTKLEVEDGVARKLSKFIGKKLAVK